MKDGASRDEVLSSCMNMCDVEFNLLIIIGVMPMANAEVQSYHLGQIAELMVEWEGRIVDKLKLTDSDVAAIKAKYPGELKLQS